MPIVVQPPKDSHLYSGAIRELNERGIEPWIDTFENLLSSVSVPADPLEMMDRFLLSLRGRTQKANDVVMQTQDDFSLAYAHDSDELNFLTEEMMEMGYIVRFSANEFRIRPAGWRRLIEISKDASRPSQAFVAMRFHEDLKDAWENGIELALRNTGYTPLRIDRKEHNEKIDDLIIAEIRKSGLLVADFTKQSNGVYFEAGFALGLGIPVIWSCLDDEEEKSQLHFDTNHYNHIMWKNPEDLLEKLTNRINATAPAPKLTV